MTMNKAQALDLLGDLLGLAPRTDLFDQPIKKPAPVKKPKWHAVALITMYRTTKCSCCGNIHHEISPLLLMHEQLRKEDGTVLLEQKTSSPESLHTVTDDVPTVVEYYPATPVNFCFYCIGVQTEEHRLHAMFAAQRKVVEEPTIVQAIDSKQKAADAEKRLMELAARLESPGLLPATTDDIRLESTDDDLPY